MQMISIPDLNAQLINTTELSQISCLAGEQSRASAGDALGIEG